MFFFFKKPTTKELVKILLKKIRYPKLILLILSIFIGYLVYKDGNNFFLHQMLEKIGYFGTFVAGFFFFYGFTTSISVASLLVLSPLQNFWLASFTALTGAIIGNFFVFRFMRISIVNELNDLSKNKLLKIVIDKVEKRIPLFIRSYILPAFAGFIAATPLPDELAVALLYWSKNTSIVIFSTISFIISVFGIFIIIWLGKII
jgi:hypothetical protein